VGGKKEEEEAKAEKGVTSARAIGNVATRGKF